jgi:hypothetical protein
MLRYEFRDDKPLGFKNAEKADAQTLGEALAGIAVEHGGHLKPADVLKAASDRRSYLSQFFTWDDAEAAESWRLAEARALIRSVEVTETTVPNDERKRAFLSISDTQGRSYRPVQQIETDARLQALVLAQAIKDLRAWQHRYRDLRDICALVEVAASAASELKKRDEPPQLEAGDS